MSGISLTVGGSRCSREWPAGLLGLDEGDFTERYLARLDALGVDHFLAKFAEISTSHDDRGLVLLCFEPAGEFCHRRLFARWFEEQTGQHPSPNWRLMAN